MLWQIVKAAAPSAATVSVLVGMAAPIIALGLGAWLFQRRYRTSGDAPQQEKLLRPAGYSLLHKLGDLLDALLQRLVFALGAGAMAGLLIQATQDVIAAVGLRPLALLPLGLAVVSATTCACLTARLLRSLGQLFAVRLGLRGEQAIGEKLIEVAYCGLRTFHDVPGDGAWNIDHVVVGTQGVFVIETKTRRKPRAGKSDQARWKVLFDGAALQFPHGKDLKAVVQAQANARWLSNYLAKKTGDAVWVEPLVAIPGWWVETTVKDPAVLAVNAKQLASYLRSLPTARVPASQVNRIIGALEEKCRTLEF